MREVFAGRLMIQLRSLPNRIYRWRGLKEGNSRMSGPTQPTLSLDLFARSVSLDVDDEGRAFRMSSAVARICDRVGISEAPFIVTLAPAHSHMVAP